MTALAPNAPITGAPPLFDIGYDEGDGLPGLHIGIGHTELLDGRRSQHTEPFDRCLDLGIVGGQRRPAIAERRAIAGTLLRLREGQDD